MRKQVGSFLCQVVLRPHKSGNERCQNHLVSRKGSKTSNSYFCGFLPAQRTMGCLHTDPVAFRGQKMTFLVQYGTSKTPCDWLASGAASFSSALSHGRQRVFTQRCSRQPRENRPSERPYCLRGKEPLDLRERSLSTLQSQHCSVLVFGQQGGGRARGGG